MTAKIFLAGVMRCMAIAICGCAIAANARAAQQSTLHNAPHLTVVSGADVAPLAGALREYSRSRGISAALTFAPSDYRMEDIAEGDVADIIVTSHPSWTQQLKQMGLLDVYSITNFAGDGLAIVAAKGKKADELKRRLKKTPYPQALNMLLKEYLLFAVVRNDVTSLGIYSAQALQTAQRVLEYDISAFTENMSPALDERGLPEPQPALRTPLPDEKTADSAFFAAQIVPVAKAVDVARRAAADDGVGIMYKASARRRRDVTVIYSIPKSAHDPIIYQMAVIAGEQMPEARDLQRYLLSPEMADMFKRKGYVPFSAVMTTK